MWTTSIGFISVMYKIKKPIRAGDSPDVGGSIWKPIAREPLPPVLIIDVWRSLTRQAPPITTSVSYAIINDPHLKSNRVD